MTIEMLNCDCMEYMAGLPDKAFDLAIVDPPYFEGPNKPGFYRTGGKYGELKFWDVPNEDYFLQLERVSLNQIIWGANHFATRFNSSGPGWIVWDKENDSSTFADAELASSSFINAVRICRYRWNGMLQGDMKNKETRIHPTQKPVKLYEWLLINYAKKGDRILDTHGGSGSLAIACHNLGFDMVWMELDKDYYDAAVKRFNAHTAQHSLFEPAPPIRQPAIADMYSTVERDELTRNDK